MHEIIALTLLAAVAVGLFTLAYKFAPFEEYGPKKPKFTVFPKYIAKFDQPINKIESSLSALEFKKDKNGIYSRGKIYGDFSTKSIKLAVKVDEQDRELRVYASFFGVLMDTGDIWQVTTDILRSSEDAMPNT